VGGLFCVLKEIRERGEWEGGEVKPRGDPPYSEEEKRE